MTKPKPLLSVVHTLGVMFYASFAWVVFWAAVHPPMVNTPLSTLLFALVIWVICRSAAPRAVYARLTRSRLESGPLPYAKTVEYANARHVARSMDLPWLEPDGSVQWWITPEDPAIDVHRQLHARRMAAQPDIGTQVKVGDDLDATWELLYGERPNSDQFKRAYRLRREETYRKAAGYVARWRDPF